GGWYLALTLSEYTDAHKLEEAERCARAMMQLQANPIFEATSRNTLARVALARGDWGQAEADARAARDGLLAILPYRFLASASLMSALGAQARHAEAAQIAREELPLLDKVGSPIFSEVPLLVSAAEVLFADGDRRAGKQALDRALRMIEQR